MGSYTRSWANRLRSRQASKPAPGFDLNDPISAYAAQLEAELDAQPPEPFERYEARSVPSGTVIGMQVALVYDDGREVPVSRIPINNTHLIPGSAVQFSDISVQVDP